MEAATTSKRPFLITVMCSVGLLYSLSALPIFNNKHFLNDSYSEFTSLVMIGCLIGFWKMRKLALYVYISVFTVNQFVALLMENWSLQTFLIPILIIGTTSLYHHKMN